MYVYNFKPTFQSIEFRKVFIAMPFEDKYDNIFHKLIEPAVQLASQKLGLKKEEVLFAFRTKEDINTTSGWINVMENLLTAQVVIGVLTSNNPNVFYELGIAHATQPLVRQILIAKKDYKPRFDLKDLIFYGYENNFGKSIDPLAIRIKQSIEMYKTEEDKIFHRARMPIGPYEFEVLMDHANDRNFVMHTSKQGREDYQNWAKQKHNDDEQYWKGAFERHVVAITNLGRQGLLGLNTKSERTATGTGVEFSYHWTDLGNCVLNLMKLITDEELKARRRGMPKYF